MMPDHAEIDTTTEDAFVVVRNDEDQYSVWWEDLALPAGWTAVGQPAPRQVCLERIRELWTDMRPRSARARLSEPDGAR